jgi:hypothetical protein
MLSARSSSQSDGSKRSDPALHEAIDLAATALLHAGKGQP